MLFLLLLRLFSIQLKILIRRTFLIGNFCSDFFLVHFPFGAQIIFSFEIFSCFSKSFSAKKIISTLLIQQQILLLNLMKRKKYQIKNKRIKRYWMREIFQERKGKSLFTKLVKVLQLFNIKEVK